MLSQGVVATAREVTSRLEIFRGIKESEIIDGIVDRFSYREFRDGDCIVRAGEAGDGMYLLLAGRVRVVANGVPLAILAAGEIFGEMALISDSRRSSDVVAASDGLCAFVSHDDFQLLFKSAPRIATNFMRVLSLRIRKLNELLIGARLSLPHASEHRAFDNSLELLRRVPIFANVTDEKFLRRVLSYMQTVDLQPGDPVFVKNDPADLMYVIESGEVLVHIDNLELARLGPGHYFGEMALLDSHPRSSSVTAVGRTSLLTLTRQQFHAAVAQSPTVGRNILHELSERISRMNAVLTGNEPGSPLDAARLDTFPEVARDDLWVRDSVTGRWHLPLSEELSADFAVAVAEPPPQPAGDDFQRALSADAAELDGALLRYHERSAGDHRLDDIRFQTLRDLGAALLRNLRTPLFPKKVHDTLAADLYRGSVDTRPVEIHIVLASPTALAELGSFLNVVGLFGQLGAGRALHVHLVRWENIVEVAHLDLSVRTENFALLQQEISQRVAAAGFSNCVITPIDVTAADPLAQIDGPPDVVAVARSVEAAFVDLATADPVIARNLLWITGFYARQASLQLLGTTQPLLDLAIRTSVGRRVGDAWKAATSTGRHGGFLLLTSELNRRFLPCYEGGMPIANIALA